MTMLSRSLTIAACLAVTQVVSCTSTRAAPDEARPADALAPPTATTDVAGTLSRAHFAFRERDGRFVAGHDTHAVSVAADGSITFHPRWSRARGAERATTVKLETTSLGRDGAPPPAVSGRPHLERDGSLATARAGGVVERLHNGAGGLEQSWDFASRPAGTGDLVVRLRPSTRARAEDSPSGVRFVDDATARAIRYEDAAWVDASGARVPLRPRLEAGEVVLRVPAAVVDGARYPATLDPTVSAASSVGIATIIDPNAYVQVEDVAPGKDGVFLVLFSDYRVDPVVDMVTYRAPELYGVRIAADGTVLDPTGFVIVPITDENLESASAAWNGSQWLVSFAQYGDFAACAHGGATRVSSAGVVLDPSLLRLACMGSPMTGFDGQDFVVFGVPDSTSPNTAPVHATYITTGGAVKNATPMAVSTESHGYALASTCDGGTACLVVYRGSNGEIRSRRVAKGGAVDASARTLGTGTPSFLRVGVTFDGTSFVALWTTASGTFARRVDPATGDPLGAAPVLVASTGAQVFASAGGTTLVAWTAGGQLLGARFAADAALDASPLTLKSAASIVGGPRLGGSGTQFLAAWSGSLPVSPGNLFALRVSTAGASLDGDGVVVRKAASGQRNPAIAGSATGWLAAWEDTRAGTPTQRPLYATRLDAAGQPLDPAGLSLGAGELPALAMGTGGWLAVWRDGVETRARTVSPTGTMGAPVSLGTSSSTYYRSTAVTFDGASYVAAYAGNAASVVRLDASGAVLTPPSPTPLGSANSVAVASSGAESLVVWADWSVRARRVAKDGSFMDASPIELASDTYATHSVAVGWDGVGYLAAWMDLREAPDSERKASVRYTRISQAGARLDPLGGRVIHPASTNQMFPAVVGVGDGRTALVTWSDNRRADRKDDFDLFGAFVRASDGAVLDPDGFPIAAEAGNEHRSALAPAAPGAAMVAYYRVDPTAGFGAERVRTRLVSAGGLLGAACAADADCASRACTDGVCCETSCRGACQACGAGGKCVAVTSAEDADSCAGDRTCDATSTCRVKRGRSCTSDAECMTGVCASGICCDRPCGGACESCASNPGTCELRAARSAGIPACAPYACDGQSASCPGECVSDASCPGGSRCDLATRSCIAGAICLDEATLGGGDAPPASCAPYRCEAVACRTTCRSVHDCVYPAVCDEGGRCVPPAPVATVAAGSGCSARGHGASDDTWPVLLGVLALAGCRRPRRRDA